MKLACTYIEAEKFEETIKFYKKIFNQEPKIYCENRWVEFENQNKLSIFNANYDKENLEKNENATKPASFSWKRLVKILDKNEK